MKRTLTTALATLAVLGAVGQSQAQDMTATRTAPLFDIGIFAGGAWTSAWFNGNATGGTGGDGYTVGFSPIFGAEATYWLSPTFGIRLDGKYMPSKLPHNNGSPEGIWPVNNWFYDLDLMWRPLFWGNQGFLSSLYVFLGGGGLTTNVVGEGRGCVATLAAAGGCLSVSPTLSTVGQGVAGLGLDVFPVTPSIGIFLEAGVHGYDSPVHTGADWVGPNLASRGEDKFAFTPYAVLGLKLGFGNIIPPPPPPPPPAPLPPPPAPVEAPPPPPPPPSMSVCTVQGGQLQSVTVTVGTAGDTTGLPTMMETTAATQPWFVNNQPIQFNGRRYVKYGVPRVLNVGDVNNVGTYQGVAVFAEPSANAQMPEVIYLPVSGRCEFQPYQLEVKGNAVRG